MISPVMFIYLFRPIFYFFGPITILPTNPHTLGHTIGISWNFNFSGF